MQHLCGLRTGGEFGGESDPGQDPGAREAPGNVTERRRPAPLLHCLPPCSASVLWSVQGNDKALPRGLLEELLSHEVTSGVLTVRDQREQEATASL